MAAAAKEWEGEESQRGCSARSRGSALLLRSLVGIGFLAAYGQLECCLLPRGLLHLLLRSHNFAIASRVHGRDSLYLLPFFDLSACNTASRWNLSLSLFLSALKFSRFSSHFSHNGSSCWQISTNITRNLVILLSEIYNTIMK